MQRHASSVYMHYYYIFVVVIVFVVIIIVIVFAGTLPVVSGSFGSPAVTTCRPLSLTSDADVDEGKNSQLNFIEDLSLSPAQYLVPMWECLQEVYKPLSMQLKEGALDFHALLPDLLFADLSSNSVIAVPEDYMVGVKIQEAKGMFMRYYYTNTNNGGDGAKVMGAEKTVSLVNTIHVQSNLSILDTTPKILS